MDVAVRQGSVLSPVLLALYLSPIFHILEKIFKNIKILVYFILFVNNGLFVSQKKSLEKLTSYLFCSYNVISSLLDQFILVIKDRKTENFHFLGYMEFLTSSFGSQHSRRLYSSSQRYMALFWVYL